LNPSSDSSVCPPSSWLVKGIFDQDFAPGEAVDEIIKVSKRWLHNNVFTPVEILRQMDIHGGTLKYEGLSVFNDVESAAYKSKRK